MKLKELEIKTERVFLNIESSTTIETKEMLATDAVSEYGELEVTYYDSPSSPVEKSNGRPIRRHSRTHIVTTIILKVNDNEVSQNN